MRVIALHIPRAGTRFPLPHTAPGHSCRRQAGLCRERVKQSRDPQRQHTGRSRSPWPRQVGWFLFFFFLFFKEDIDSYSPVGPAVLRAQPREVRRAAPLNSLCPWPRRRGEGDGSPPVAGGGGDWGAVSSSGLCLSRPGRGTASVVASWVRGTVLMLVLDSL